MDLKEKEFLTTPHKSQKQRNSLSRTLYLRIPGRKASGMSDEREVIYLSNNGA
jgi:hypothetical protein